MQIKQITLSIIFLAVLINNHITAMNHQNHNFRQPKNVSFMMANVQSLTKIFPDSRVYILPQPTEYPYKNNARQYEIVFKGALASRLGYLKAMGRSESFLKSYEKDMLTSMEKEKNKILIRNKYYPTIKTLEWKK